MSEAFQYKCPHHPLGHRSEAIARANIKALWEALSAIREYVEDIAPPGSVPNAEYVDGPEPMREAEAIIEGIHKLVKSLKEPPAKPIMIFTGH